MRLGLTLSAWDTGDLADTVRLAVEADRLGYSVCWAPEAYGTDAATLLATVAARTERIDIGSGVFQIPARAPAMTAMTAATLDALSGGRFRLGLGVSGPQVSEGWYGVRFDHPLARTRDYVQVVRQVLRRERLEYAGKHLTLPLPDGPGKPLRLSVRPLRPDLPVYLAAVGPRNLELAGEIADGWLGVFVAPEFVPDSLAHLRAGRARADGPDGADSSESLAGFDVVACAPVVTGDDVEACAMPVRGYAALYLGGMGSRTQNFYNALAGRMGYAEQAARVQDLYLARQHRDAAAAVPFEFVDSTSLLGPVDRIAGRLRAYADAGVTTVAVSPFGATHEDRVATLHTTAEAFAAAGVGE
ncbi:probable F420-dependent oxidoreductase, Rv3520c family [Actinopolymorpha cephalotaxi]|uniref:F420-dependent oxidoreductase-like protein n=1 Tax=Actinopolymorpha cephalotaxi TaxID=504797 RepID=A0A1I3BMP8_9ACTN|nr:LLM class F420-dependent oxidoreductase [Actinopolymorpha cephalotaxi]NYH82869.1 F420-dependent oxidoreductase-like protein [Actinopolymorpha cephalotaxi]SFH63450.1 probable F420-dependent oxidoreductase, Rv3520c family [Actinopolymorpha cephalotaxi]